MIHRFSLWLFSLLLTGNSFTLLAQKSDPFIRIAEPDKLNQTVTSKQVFITGLVCKECSLTINNDAVKVYPTGAFAYKSTLTQSQTTFTLLARSGSKKVEKTVVFTYDPPDPEKPVATFSIERIQTIPAGDLLLSGGDEVIVKVKALPGCKASIRQTPLKELPIQQADGMAGIYQGVVRITEDDQFNNDKWSVQLISSNGDTIYKKTTATFTVMNNQVPMTVMTNGRLAHLEYGLGEDRLGGAKIGYIDSAILLRVIGKIGNDYKVRLAPSRTAIIPDDVVKRMPEGVVVQPSLTGKIRVHGDASYDFVKVQLFSKLPYQSMQKTDPAQLVVDVFGATNNTNWIDQLQSAKAVRSVTYEQVADEIFRLTITLHQRQHWGHTIYYSGNQLVIRIRRQPEDLRLHHLTIAVDAGHGGSNPGASGLTGSSEKDLALQLALRVQKILKQKGARVIMTREKEQFVDNKERILFYRDSVPDLLISIHLNSASDPFAAGTSTFYRYEGFRLLSQKIYQRMLELGLKEYGNNGSFNFMLNSPTEYPNALVETLFLSNPEEEMKILDTDFQQQMAEKMVQGIEDFLETCR
ncbi:MAG: N-acetylmuramoyl-L-alanine amidase [Ferruginibacter sp.]